MFRTCLFFLVTSVTTAFGAAWTLPDVPHVRQKPDYCGEACVSMAMQYWGLDVSQDDVWARSGLPADAGRGCWTPDLYKAIQGLDIETPSPWVGLPADARQSRAVMQSTWEDIKQQLAGGTPVIVCMLSHEGANPTEHFRLIVGFDSQARTVTFHDPAVDDGAYMKMSLDSFAKLWPLGDGRGGRMLVRFYLPAPGELEAAEESEPPAARTFDEERDAIAARMSAKLGSSFRVTTEGPFAIAGNLGVRELASFQEGTIRWAYERLRTDFFDQTGLVRPISIYLFRDDATYRRYTTELFGDAPDTPYGYYTPTHEALVMNISTGGGTLVHEMVHPMLACDFPRAPSWINEGLGSLFEQCGERNGRIRGFLNWRLPGLQRTIRDGDHVPLRELMSTSRAEFYGARSGTHYAEARYLLYWLQEQDLLREYYRRFRAAASTDRTGIRTLEELTGRSLEELESGWLDFVRGLELARG